jgi:O-acetyl-ADP-ribose deacetylase (regulator of RNase III)
MHALINNARLELVLGDITDQEVDAVVNAANSRLAGGGGVDGAIHRRGGPGIMKETSRVYTDGCPTGSAVISGAGDLAARYVIHAVGPRWKDGQRQESELLASAYQRCLELAVEHNCASLALPSLSTGAYRFPLDQAAEIAMSTVSQFLSQHGQPELVRFVLWDDGALAAFSQALTDLHR